MTKRVPKIIQQWADSIALRSPKKMISMYSNKAILLATFEPLIVGKKDILKYFEMFLAKEGLQCKITTNLTQIDRDRDTRIASGLYTFSFMKNGYRKKIVKARYTFVINEGIIINHHSSLVPEED
tara:strand:- start:3215 stop:3589 length:375 start_codon:yes stop_codon:yes gene_type:complete